MARWGAWVFSDCSTLEVNVLLEGILSCFHVLCLSDFPCLVRVSFSGAIALALSRHDCNTRIFEIYYSSG